MSVERTNPKQFALRRVGARLYVGTVQEPATLSAATVNRVIAIVIASVVGACGAQTNKATARDRNVQRAVESKIRQTINLNALGQGLSVKFLTVQCLPASDTTLSCVVSGSVQGRPVTSTWEGIVDPETGRFNVHSAG